MVEYFKEQELIDAKTQKNKTFAVYLVVLAIYLVFSVIMYVWYFGCSYQSSVIKKIKFYEFTVNALFVVFSFIYLGIKQKRVRRYYKLLYNMSTGIKETSTGSFFEYDESLQDKDGVDMKSLVFIEWNKYKNDFFERKVLVLYEKPFPKLKEKDNVKYITQGNVLISYEVL